MQLLRDVAQQARYQAMQPGQINQHWAQAHADLQAFDAAVAWARNAQTLRASKRAGNSIHSPGRLEAMARECEQRVREFALRSEIELQRRFEMAQADRAMLRAMMTEAA